MNVVSIKNKIRIVYVIRHLILYYLNLYIKDNYI